MSDPGPHVPRTRLARADANGPSVPRPAGAVPATRTGWTFVITSAALFIFALDRLVVVTALPAIRADLGGGLDAQEWTVNAYTLTFAVLLLTGAALGDRFGRRRMFIVGLAVFTVGSAAAGLASTAPALVAARALQGIGGAVLIPLTLTILSASVPPHRRAAVIGAWGGIGSLGSALGPVVGGALAGYAGWQWIFWLNVPIGLVLLPLARLLLTESYGPAARLDITGVVLASTGLFALVWALIRAGGAGWTHPSVLLPLAAAAPALAAFVGWETRTHAPMVPPQLFRDRTFATASLASVAMYSAAFGVLFLLTQLLQVGLGAAPLDAGLRTVPLAAMPVLLAPLGGLLCGRFGARPLMIVALSLETVAFAWLALAARPDVTYPVLLPALLMMGAGLPLFWSPIASVSLGAARPQEQGQASGASTAIRELAIVLGVAALAATFTARGGDSSPTGVLTGFPPAAWLAAGLAAAGLIATIAMPARRSSPAAADPRPVAEAAAA